MPRETYRNTRIASLRADYDGAFEMLRHARKELGTRGGEGASSDYVRLLQRNVDLAQIAWRRTRNDLANCSLERIGRSVGR